MARSSLHVAIYISLLLTALHAAGCGGSSGAPAAVASAGQTAVGGATPTAAGGALTETAGSAGAPVAAGSAGAAAVAGAGGSGGAPPSAAGASGGGASGAGGASVAAGGGLPDVSSDGDGDRVIGPMYTPTPLLTDNLPAASKGKQISFNMQSTDSTIYKGVNGAYTRGVKVYIPAKYTAGTAAPFIVTQDAMGTDTLPAVLDNLIDMKMLPKLVVIFVSNGGGDAQGSERGLEYDTVSGLFAEFIDKEVLPRVISEVNKQLSIELTLTTDPDGRGTFGGSSGGAASFSMAWWHPDLFRRVLSYSGTFVSQITDPTPFPHGCWVYHDVDPHFVQMSEAPKGLIVQRCEGAMSAIGVSNPGPCDTPLTQETCTAVMGCTWITDQNKPIRAWLESADGDLGTNGHELDPKYGTKPYRDFDIANQRMAAALKLRGYHYHYDHALNAGHVDGNVVKQTLAEALLWVWRGYPVE
ncbi:MAG TPA: alpha/beta hydrolase-fold protein [Polyangiaceae bacterium]